jgi:hypothetical protein
MYSFYRMNEIEKKKAPAATDPSEANAQSEASTLQKRVERVNSSDKSSSSLKSINETKSLLEVV